MKRIAITISILLFCGVAVASTQSRIIDYICGRKLPRQQLKSLTWKQVATYGKNQGMDPNTFKGSRNTIKNAVMSDLRQREIEKVRGGIETLLLEYNQNIRTFYSGYEQSTVDPNFVVCVYKVEVPIGAVH